MRRNRLCCAPCRKVFVVDHDLRVQCELELQPKLGSLTELTWLSNTALLATSNGGIQGWLYTHGSGQSSLVLGRSIGIVTASPSPDHATLAAGSRDGVVRLRPSPQNTDIEWLSYGVSTSRNELRDPAIEIMHALL